MPSEPTASRPQMPGYGVREDAEGMLPWSWARERLENTRNYWVCTTRPDGRPHAMAVWGLWHGDNFWFSTAITSTKARNLARNPSLVVCAENGAQAVVLEGTAAIVEDEARLRPVWDAYKAKYNWPMEGQKMFAVRPTTVFAFIEAAESFGSTATRWLFDA